MSIKSTIRKINKVIEANMSTFWELLKQSIITQAVLTMVIWGAIIYLSVTGQPVSDLLSQAGSLVLGFFFGSKLAYATQNTIKVEVAKAEPEIPF